MLDYTVPAIKAAHEIASAWHGDQKRKYTGAAYLTHLVEVAELVAGAQSVTFIPIAAALLHDVLEDTDMTRESLLAELTGNGVQRGHALQIIHLVEQVTDVSQPHHGNRAARKAMDLEHLARATAWGQTIKYADLISNTSTIVEHDVGFARVYLPEKRRILERLTSGDRRLRAKASVTLKLGERKLLRIDQEKQMEQAIAANEARKAQPRTDRPTGWGMF